MVRGRAELVKGEWYLWRCSKGLLIWGLAKDVKGLHFYSNCNERPLKHLQTGRNGSVYIYED
jgi:hypothetical protein